MKKRYTLSLFLIGFALNVFVRFFLLFIASVILLIIGIWSIPCRYIGFGVLLFDVIISFVEQLLTPKSLSEESDNPDFSEFQDAVSSDNWMKNIMNFVESRMTDENRYNGDDGEVEQTDDFHDDDDKN